MIKKLLKWLGTFLIVPIKRTPQGTELKKGVKITKKF